MQPNKEASVYRSHTFHKMGHGSVRNYLKRMQQLLDIRNQANLFRLDAPTESLGNCYPYALMQNLHKPEIYANLTNELK